MPVAVSYPGVYIQEVSSGVRTITGVATSIALFIGWAPKGPVDRAVRITSYTDFERVFGGLHAESYLGYAVRHFFGNGGADAYVIRIVETETTTGADATEKHETAHKTAEGLVLRASSPGLWGNYLMVRKTVTDQAKKIFKLEVLYDSDHEKSGDYAVVESFVGLTMTKTDKRYAPAILNAQSAYLAQVEEPAPPASPAPAAPASPASPPTPVDIKLAGGKDGTVLNPDDAHFKDAVTGLFGEGKIADRIDLFNIICVPGLTDTTKLGELQTIAKARRAFLVADCRNDANEVGDIVALPTSSEQDYSAFYFPWVLAPDPLQSQAVRGFPPSGFVAGVMARTDSERGVWKAPAGTDAVVNGAAGLAVDMSDPENGELNKKGVNCLRTFPVYGNVVWGARTLDGNDDIGSEWKYVPVRRLALFLEESLYRGTQWVVFEPNDEPLWAQIRLNVGAFMNTLFRQGAFQGSTPKDAYFVKCDKETTPQNQINLGIVNIVVGFAPLKPAEFVIITIQQMAGQIQV